MRYFFNYFDYVKQALLPDKKKPRILAFLESLLAPVQALNDDFETYIPIARRKATFTGQVVYLERLLNDEFDPTLRRIYIADGQANVLPPFVFNKVEQRPAIIYNKAENATPFYLYNSSEYFTEPDFIIMVPASVLNPAIQVRIERQVNQYKQAGKNFQVQTI